MIISFLIGDPPFLKMFFTREGALFNQEFKKDAKEKLWSFEANCVK